MTLSGVKTNVVFSPLLQVKSFVTEVLSPSKNPQILASVGAACNTIPSEKVLGKVKQ